MTVRMTRLHRTVLFSASGGLFTIAFALLGSGHADAAPAPDFRSGDLRHVAPAAPRSIVVGSAGLVAVAGSPDADRWAKSQGSPGLGVADECYVLFLDKSGVRGEWRPGKPVTGPLAIGMHGEQLVPVSGELCGIE